MSTVSVLAVAGPLVTPKVPAGSPASQCSARHTSGFGKRSNKPSLIIASAPMPRSSAGCAMKTSVPFHWSFEAASARAAPIQHVMCMSWPQACITDTSLPASSFVVVLLT
jgi:hypothetical protein